MTPMKSNETKSSVAVGASEALPSVIRGSIVGVDGAGRPIVAWGDGDTASADAVHMGADLDWRRCRGIGVFLAFEDGEPTRPVVVGLLEAPPRAAGPPDVVRIESGKEMVLECGKAKIALRADGRSEIRGGHLISRSSGPNKIKGGSVHIN